jgi:hypothetical protein
MIYQLLPGSSQDIVAVGDKTNDSAPWLNTIMGCLGERRSGILLRVAELTWVTNKDTSMNSHGTFARRTKWFFTSDLK